MSSDLTWVVPVSTAAVGAAAAAVVVAYWLFAAGYERRLRARFRGQARRLADR
ncbi:hypothetical protein [Nocardia blacklockiae]|uniref:hypothetical protein n=1 Tax=Nocardia blacklockiae TaxID=480036 RepID=UPI001895458A|nr:hypothetical protein [Nocardia blacklockiae]MBF6171869.1 hypothetical protein [Nocardia blacklockiae]